MPKYYDFMVSGYFLSFTAECIVEALHVHASDQRLTEAGSAKFFVKGNGDTVVQHKGRLTELEMRRIRRFIKENYEEMYQKWSALSDEGYYHG